MLKSELNSSEFTQSFRTYLTGHEFHFQKCKRCELQNTDFELSSKKPL